MGNISSAWAIARRRHLLRPLPTPDPEFHELVDSPTHVWDAEDITTIGIDAATWPARVGGSTLLPTTNGGAGTGPRYRDDEDGWPCVTFQQGGLMAGPAALSSGTDFGIAVRFRLDTLIGTIKGCVAGFITQPVGNAKWSVLAPGLTAQTGQMALSGGDNAVNKALTLNETQHVGFFERQGSTMYLTFDAGATSTAAAPAGTGPLDRINIGQLVYNGASVLYPLFGSVSKVSTISGRRFTSTERANLAAWTPPARGGLTPDFSTVGNATGRTGAYTTDNATFSSSIDALLVNLTNTITYDDGCAAAAIAAGQKLPVLLFLHGYAQDMGAITSTVMERAADHGFVAISTNMRGRAGNSGLADDSARELQDLWDSVDAAAALFPDVIDVARVHIIGYSGGGANAVAIAAKFPGRAITILSQFGWGDYGYSAVLGHSYWASGDNPAAVVTRIGARSDLQPYRARLANTNISLSVSQVPTELWMFWDSQDTIGMGLRDVRNTLRSEGAPIARWYADESNPRDSDRWLHGYPEQSPDLLLLENLVFRRVDEPAPTITVAADVYTVTGYVVHAAGFEVWTADTGTANPKTHASGGKKHVVHVTFNVDTRHFSVELLSGPCAVRISIGGSVVTKDVSVDNTAFDL